MKGTPVKQWSSEAVEAVLALQGIALAPGRAERLAAGLNAGANAVDPLRDTLALEVDPTSYLLCLERSK